MIERVRGGGWHMIEEIDLVAMIADHSDLGRLCDRLEEVADALPGLPPAGAAVRLCQELEQRPPMHEAYERALLDTLFGSAPEAPGQEAAFQHIRRRSGSHVVQAQDLVTALQPGGPRLPPSTLGYMLRCYFEGCRCDMAFEELAILQFAGERLTPDARALLEHSLAMRCQA
ncbi:MAG TPA: hypothetical protein VGC10_01800 [Sphingomonas sp.]